MCTNAYGTSESTIIFLSFFFFFFYLKKAQHSFIFLANVNINNFHTLQP